MVLNSSKDTSDITVAARSAPQRWLNTGICAVVAGFPALCFLHGSVAGAILHLLAFIGLCRLIALAITPASRSYIARFAQCYGLLVLAMLGPLLANIIGQVADGRFSLAGITVPEERLALAGLVLFALIQVPASCLRRVQWGILLSVIIAVAILMFDSDFGLVRPEPDVLNLLNFTNLLVLMGLFALCMLGWNLTSRYRFETVLKVAVFLVSLPALVISESRGPLLSLLFLLAYYVLFCLPARFSRRRWLILPLLIVMLGGMLMSSADLRERMDEGVSAVVQNIDPAEQGVSLPTGDASTRIRLQLWGAAWDMFREKPWTGDSRHSFSARLIELNRAGQATEETTWRGADQHDAGAYTQPHNEILNAMATRGLPGLIALLGLYLVPFVYFNKRKRQYLPSELRVPLNMGRVTCVAVICFGLTVCLFTSSMVTSFYVLTISVLIALGRAQSEEATLAGDDGTSAGPYFPGKSARYLFKKLYISTHGHRQRYNYYLWPYVSLKRASDGLICEFTILGQNVPLIPFHEARGHFSQECHVILSGPSVNRIDYSRLGGQRFMGVNGSIALAQRFEIAFPFYCIIDRDFVDMRADLVRQIVATDRIVFLSPDVLCNIYRIVPASHIRCRFCLLENILEPAFGAVPDPGRLTAWQQAGRDIHLFDATVPLGFSFEPQAGWFDADTVAYAALQLLVWAGVRRIYFHGLDITSAASVPRFYEQGPSTMAPSRLEKHFNHLIRPSFAGAIPLLAARGIHVYNLSPASAIPNEIMPFKDWRELIPKDANAAL